MPRFRDRSSDAAGGPLILENVRALIAELFRPEHFFLGADLEWKWEHVALEELVWEIFQGRLLDPAHTRQRRSFEAWNVYQAGAEEPLLALKLDAGAGHLHVVRGLDSYVWEGYDAGGNVYQSRERRKWVRELVARSDSNAWPISTNWATSWLAGSFRRWSVPAGCRWRRSKHRCRVTRLASYFTATGPPPRRKRDHCTPGASW